MGAALKGKKTKKIKNKKININGWDFNGAYLQGPGLGRVKKELEGGGKRKREDLAGTSSKRTTLAS